jgi:DNA-binding NarL/FixJ family response regulator
MRNSVAAQRVLDEARAICTPLDAKLALARADALAMALAARVTPRPIYPDGLTVREIAVLRLVAQGRSNQEIAEALSMSARTAERHISNIYGKIHAHGRAEATAYAFQHALT